MGSRPSLGPGSDAVDLSTSPVDGAWLAGGDLVDVVRATGDRDGWTEDEVRRAQAKITSASARKQPPRWLHFLERATEWVNVAPLPSPVTEARMLPWAKDLLLARVSRVPSAASLAWAGFRDSCDAPKSRSPAFAACPPGGLKRKRGLGEGAGTVPEASTPPIPTGLFGPGVLPGGPSPDGVHDDPLEVKVEPPSYSPIPGGHSVASDYSGGEDEGGSYLCPAWAIKHRLPHLVYTSAYQGGDCTGAYWASASPGGGVAMRVVARPVDTAIDPATDDDGGGTPSPAADSASVGAGRRWAGNRR